jgi:hypothetical protein
MSTPDRDPEFEAFLERRSLLPHSLAEAENAEPPAELDRVVLEKAQAAVTARKRFRSNRWPVPVALAATVLISLAIVVQLQRPSPETYTAASRTEQRAVTQSQSFEPASAPREPGFASESPRVPETASLRSMPDSSAADLAQERESYDATGPEQDAAASGAARERLAKAAAPPTESKASAREESRRQIASTDGAVAAAPPPAPVLADAPQAATGAATDSVAAAEAENGRSAAPAANAERDPQAWLQRIARLRAEGKKAQADREWKAFVKRYPDYVTDGAAK